MDTSDAAFEVVCSQLDRELWLEARRTGIGASESPVLCMGSLYGRTPLTIWAEKMGHGEPAHESEAMSLGKDLEDFCLRRFQKEASMVAVACGLMVRSKEHPFMTCTPDAWIQSHEAILEAKTTGTLAAWQDGVPEHVRIQVQHQLYVTGLKTGYACVLAGGVQGMAFRWAKVDRDDAFIQDTLLPACKAFWAAVEKGEPPAPTGSEEDWRAAARLRTPSPGLTVALDGHWVDLDARLQEVIGLQKPLAWEEREIKAKLTLAMGDSETAYMPNGIRYTRKQQTRKAHHVEESTFAVLRRHEDA